MLVDRRELLVAAGATWGAAILASSAYSRPNASVAGRADSAARAALATGCAPGLAMAVAERGRMLLNRGYGQADLGRRKPVSARTPFHIGSLTKQFTAAAALKLASQGRLDLDAPVSALLPAFVGKPRFTLRETMHHTAGLHESENGTPPPPGSISSQVELANAIAGQARRFDFDPGTAWLYSNSNYIVLGAAIEVATGERFDRAMQSLLFGPLGLRSTSVVRTLGQSVGEAVGYTYDDQRDPPGWSRADALDVWQAGGAGAMRSTTADLLRWHHMLLSGQVVERRLLLAPGRLRDGRLAGENRLRSEDSSYGDVQYAAGLLVAPPRDGRLMVQHYGFISGFAAILETDLNSMRSWVALQNADPWPKLHFGDLRRAVFEPPAT